MYQLIENPVRMTRHEIQEKYFGKWVYCVKPEGPPFGWVESAIPMVVADKPYEDSSSGIYTKIHNDNGEYIYTFDLRDNLMIGGFHKVLTDERIYTNKA